MMATIRAGWKRTIRVAPYENETLELGVEAGWDEVNDGPPENGAAHLNRQLTKIGDALVAERLAAVPEVRENRATVPDQPVASRSQARQLNVQRPAEPDPFV
jgi:hypothetical protein